MKTLTKNWFQRISRNNEPSVRIICFHYSGGSASYFSAWKSKFEESIELIAAQLPGRDTRINEPFEYSFENLIEELTDAIIPFLKDPIVLFGHSLGAYIVFELTRSLCRQKLQLPQHIIVSGAAAPHT